MVRTKADNGGRKAVAAKAPRKVLGSSASAAKAAGPTSPANNKYGGGNPVCVRPTPEWQKGIGGFLMAKTSQNEENTPPAEVTVDVHIHTGLTQCTASASSSTEATSGAGATGSSAVEPSLTVCDEPESSESGRRNGLIDSDSDDD